MSELIEVDRKALHEVLTALVSPPHVVREMQAISRIRDDCPIKKLVADYETPSRAAPRESQAGVDDITELFDTPDASGWTPPNPPHIVCAANRAGDGVIYCGSRHFSNAMVAQMEAAGLTREQTSASVQGFIDQYDRFWDREQALRIMRHTGQPIRHEDEWSRSELFSENLY